MSEPLTPEEKQTLLRLARQALELGVRGEKLPPLDWDSLSPTLRADGASFVTLTVRGDLRGCVGALEAYQSLAADVREHAIAAALEDYRFRPVQVAELNGISIEVSRLTAPVPLEYSSPEDLIKKLRPGVDGVILRDGSRRATFLPQVWEELRDFRSFFAHLGMKAGLGSDPLVLHPDVYLYQVEKYTEHEE